MLEASCKWKEDNRKWHMHCQKSVLFKNIIGECRAIKYVLTNYDTPAWFVTVDKMAGIFTKRIWQAYIYCNLLLDDHVIDCKSATFQ